MSRTDTFTCSRFLAILACNTSCTDRHAVKGMDPAAHTGDGFQDIIIVRTTNSLYIFTSHHHSYYRSRKFHILHFCDISFGQRIKHQVPSPCLTSQLWGWRSGTLHQTRWEFSQQMSSWDLIFHLQDKPSEVSSWNCDGELVDNPNIFVKSHKQLVPVFAR